MQEYTLRFTRFGILVLFAYQREGGPEDVWPEADRAFLAWQRQPGENLPTYNARLNLLIGAFDLPKRNQFVLLVMKVYLVRTP